MNKGGLVDLISAGPVVSAAGRHGRKRPGIRMATSGRLGGLAAPGDLPLGRMVKPVDQIILFVYNNLVVEVVSAID